MRFTRLLLLIPLLVCVTLAQAATINLVPGFHQQDLAGVLEYLEDKEGLHTPTEMAGNDPRFSWHISERPTLNFGFTDAVYWARFELESTTTSQVQNIFLEIGYPLLDDIRVYFLQDGQVLREYRVGASQPYNQRLVRHANFLIPMDVSPQPLQVLLRVQSQSSMQIPLLLWEKDAFVENTYAVATAFGLFYGTVLIIAIYNLLVFFSVREPGFLYFFIYSIGVVMFESALRGVAFAFIWPEAVNWVDRSIIVGIHICTLFGALFTNNVLLVRQTRPLMSRWLQLVMMLSVVCMIGSLILPYRVMIPASLLVAVLTMIVSPIAHILRVMDGYTPAKYILFGSVVSFLSIFVLIFSKVGWLPRNTFTEYTPYLGTVFQLLLFSLSLADRLNTEGKLREEAQLRVAASQKELLDMQLKINEDLDRRVRERTDELRTANTRLQELSTTDSLTGLRNRRYFDEMLQNEYKRAFREKLPLAVLLFDIDHFKKLNDSFGHPFGDLCLVEAAKLVRAGIRRPPDIAARYGGEEFVVLLPQTNLEGAIVVANSICLAFSAKSIEDGEHRVSITVSIGVACTIPQERDGHEKLLKDADKRLYQAKRNGRNRVEWESDLT